MELFCLYLLQNVHVFLQEVKNYERIRSKGIGLFLNQETKEITVNPFKRISSNCIKKDRDT